MDAIDTRTVNNLTVSVYVDDEGECANPRDNDGNGGLVLVDSYQHLLGSPEIVVDDAGIGNLTDYETWAEVAGDLPADVVCVLPIFGGRDSHGWTFTTGEMSEVKVDRWNSQQIGFTYMTRDRLGIEPGATILPAFIQSVESCLRAEIEEYCHWLNGEVYGYVVTTPLGTVLDSCWGFVGEDHVLREGVSVAESYTAEDAIRADMAVLIAESRKVRDRELELAHEIAELRIALNSATREPYCNHDSIAVRDGICECGEEVDS